MADYQYPRSNSNGVIIPHKLQSEILDGWTGPTLLRVNLDEELDQCIISFESELNQTQEDAVTAKYNAHSATPDQEDSFITSCRMCTSQIITEDDVWEELGGIVTNPSSIHSNLSQIVGRITGRVKTVKGGLDELPQLRFIEEVAGVGTNELMTPSNLPDTSGLWENFTMTVDAQSPSSGANFYTIEARLNYATTCEFKYVTSSFLKRTFV